jgi:CubicO group peptidase (beta-lactamase class C family)
LLLVLPARGGDEFSFPEGVPGARAQAFLAMYASGKAEDIREFERTHRVSNGISIRQRVEYLIQLRNEYGDFDPVRVITDEPLVVLAHSEHREEYVTLRFRLEEEEPRRLVGVYIRESYSPALHDIRAGEWKDLEELLTAVRGPIGIPAIAAAVVEGDVIRDAACVGVTRADGDDPAALDARFHVGSLGKAMTAVLVAKLIEEGELSWDTTLAEILPDVEMLEEWEGVDLRMLLQHRSGMLRDGIPAGWDGLAAFEGTPVEQRRALAATVLARKPVLPPGSTALYSNAGYGVLGHLVEVRMGTPWEELIVERVFTPLGMVRAGTGPAACTARPLEPYNHTWSESGTPVPREFVDIYLPPAVAPAGDVHMSIGDLALWASFHLKGLRGEGDFLDTTTILRLHTPPGGVGYAMGWSVGSSPDRYGEHAHSGSDGSAYAHIALYPELDLGVVIALNVEGSPEVTGAVRMITAGVRERFGRPRSR